MRLKLVVRLALVFQLVFAVGSYHLAHSASSNVDPDADYDRLDGSGTSGETAQVIEWEGNLEIHVYPPGTLKGLALKLDNRNKDKPVMVIGYRFNNNPKQQLIRRAIIGVPFFEGFKAYKDPTEAEFDKIIISNNGLSGQVVSYRLDPTPTQLYPDGHPALAQSGKSNAGNNSRSPASVSTGNAGNSVRSNSAHSYNNPAYAGSGADLSNGASYGQGLGDDSMPARANSRGQLRNQNRQSDPLVDDAGTIQPFMMNR